MASVVNICNSALSHLGDSASVTSIAPPDGSAQARHCAQWYPLARQRLLVAHEWGFATRRVALAEVANPSSTWRYAYASPNGALKVWAVLAPDASSDTDVLGVSTQQNFERETNAAGDIIILTNQENAIARYTHDVTDTVKFDVNAVDALEWLLASLLAGPILKGDAGRQAAQVCAKAYKAALEFAAGDDAQQRNAGVTHTPVWIGGR